jgi:excisionase family DNA binding protein
MYSDNDILNRLENAKEIAAFLNVSVAAVRKWTRDNMPVIRCGRACRYSRDEVLAWLRRRSEAKKELGVSGGNGK